MKGKRSRDELVQRSYPATLRADGDSGDTIVGMPIVFNQEALIEDWAGTYKEVIQPTALDDTDMKDVRLFVNHDVSKITMARSKNGKGTMSLTVDDKGVNMEAKLDVNNNAEARALHSAISRGDMDGMSFMFRVADDNWVGLDDEYPTRVIKSISIIHEVSVVNFPAYAGTHVSARNMEETEFSPLAEARRIAQTEETVLLERLRNRNIIRRF